MRRLRKRKGSIYLLVIVVFIFVSLFSALMLSNVSQSIFQINTYSLQMQCYYLNQQAAEATVAVLLDNSNELLNGIIQAQSVMSAMHKPMNFFIYRKTALRPVVFQMSMICKERNAIKSFKIWMNPVPFALATNLRRVKNIAGSTTTKKRADGLTAQLV